MKAKVSQAQNNWFVVNATSVYKRGVRRSAYPWYEYKVKCVRKQLRMVMLWEFFLVYLSLVKVIPETRVFN